MSSSTTLRPEQWFKVRFQHNNTDILTAMPDSKDSSHDTIPLTALIEAPDKLYATQNFQFSPTDLGQVGTQLYLVRNNATGPDYYLGLADDNKTAVMKRFNDADASLLWGIASDADAGIQSASIRNYALGASQQLDRQGNDTSAGIIGMISAATASTRFNISSGYDIGAGGPPAAHPPAKFNNVDPLRSISPSTSASSTPTSGSAAATGTSDANAPSLAAGPPGTVIAVALIGALLAIGLLSALGFFIYRRRAKREKLRELNSIDFLGSGTSLTDSRRGRGPRSGSGSALGQNDKEEARGDIRELSVASVQRELLLPPIATERLLMHDDELREHVEHVEHAEGGPAALALASRSVALLPQQVAGKEEGATTAARSAQHRRLEELSVSSASVSGFDADEVSSLGSSTLSPRKAHSEVTRWPSAGTMDDRR